MENDIYKPGIGDFLSRNDQKHTTSLGFADYFENLINSGGWHFAGNFGTKEYIKKLEELYNMRSIISGQEEIYKSLTPEAKDVLAREMHSIMLNGLTEEHVTMWGAKKSGKPEGIKSPSEEHMKASKEGLTGLKFSDEDWKTLQDVASMGKSAVERFQHIVNGMCEVYQAKNHDYGNSFDKSLDEDGLIAAKVRIGDKYNRFGNLIRKENKVSDESVEDTLLDMANYAIITVMWMRGK